MAVSEWMVVGSVGVTTADDVSDTRLSDTPRHKLFRVSRCLSDNDTVDRVKSSRVESMTMTMAMGGWRDHGDEQTRKEPANNTQNNS